MPAKQFIELLTALQVLVVDLSVGDVEADDMSRAQSAVIPDKGPNDNQNSQDRMSRVQSQALGN